MEYAVLVDTGSEWPEVVFVGPHDQAWAYVHKAALDELPVDLAYTVTAVVSPDDALKNTANESA